MAMHLSQLDDNQQCAPLLRDQLVDWDERHASSTIHPLRFNPKGLCVSCTAPFPPLFPLALGIVLGFLFLPSFDSTNQPPTIFFFFFFCFFFFLLLL